MFESSDEQLVKKALAGHKKSWLLLLSRYEKSIYNYALRMTSDPDDAKDLLQEIFISVYNSLSSFKGKGSFKGWLFRIAHFRCMDFFRRRQPNVSLDDAPEVQEQTCVHSPELDAQINQQQLHLHSIMRHLPVNQREVVELKFFGQFTFEDIASQLGISVNTVKSRLYSATSKLKELVEVEHVQSR